MHDSQKTAELIELLGAAWDGSISAESFARLERLLENDNGACDTLVAFSRMQVELAWLAAASEAHEKSLSLLAPHFSESATSSTTGLAPPRASASAKASVSLKNGSRISRRTGFAIAISAIVCLAAFAWQSLFNGSQVVERMVISRAPLKVARLAAVDDAVWKDGVERLPGDLFSFGEPLELVEGTAQISMACGADVLLQSPCFVKLTSQQSLRLERGILTAQVAEWGKGFAVVSAGLRITDLGTRFGVAAASPDATEVRVFEGVVRVEPVQGDLDSHVVRAGQAIQWNRAKGEITLTTNVNHRFIETLPVFRPLYPIDIADSGRGLGVGGRDPRWRISQGHASGGQFPSQAVVVNPATVYLDNAQHESQWISVAGGTSRGVEGFTQYTFETSFDLAKVDPSTVHLIAQMLVDNRVQEVRLNGERVAVEPWEMYNESDFQRFHVVEIADGFVNGTNRIEIDVINGAVIDGRKNPMALRVEWQAFGCAL